MNDATLRTHTYAVEIEHILSRAMGVEMEPDRMLFNADGLERSLESGVMFLCGYLLKSADAKKESRIRTFINDWTHYCQIGLRELLSYETNTKQIGNSQYEIEFDNGEEAVRKLIEELRHLSED